MKKLLFWFLILGACFLPKESTFSQQVSSEEQELGKISLMIHDFEYKSFSEDPEGISWSSRHKLGEPQDFIIRIFPVNEEFKKIQREMLRVKVSIPPKMRSGGLFFRPKSFEELLEWLQKGWAPELAAKPTAVNEVVVFKVPAGEYFFDYGVAFENKRGTDILFPAVRTMRENDRNLPLWGPLRVTVSKGETAEVDIRPTYKNAGKDLGFDFVERYMSDILD